MSIRAQTGARTRTNKTCTPMNVHEQTRARRWIRCIDQYAYTDGRACSLYLFNEYSRARTHVAERVSLPALECKHTKDAHEQAHKHPRMCTFPRAPTIMVIAKLANFYQVTFFFNLLQNFSHKFELQFTFCPAAFSVYACA